MLHYLQPELYTHICSITAPTRFHSTLFGLEFLSDPHCTSAVLQGIQTVSSICRETDRHNIWTLPVSRGPWTLIASVPDQVIWHCYWLRMEVKLEQRGHYQLLCGLIQIHETKHEKLWPSLHLLDSAFSLTNLVTISFISLFFFLLLAWLCRSGQNSFPSHKCPCLRGARQLCGAELGWAWTKRQGAAHLLRGTGQSLLPHTKDAALLLLLWFILLVFID